MRLCAGGRRCTGDVMGTPVDAAGSRSQTALLGCLLLAVLLQGCLSDDPLTEGNHWAEIKFDGYTVGEDWDTSGRSISCERESDGGRLSRLVTTSVGRGAQGSGSSGDTE